MMLTILAPAKINWFLEITGKREDGFHELETVMQTVSLFDELTFESRNDGEIHLLCDQDLGPIEKNLVYRAAKLLRDNHAEGLGVNITLAKVIPHGAGLGGGSSDAANALVALNRLWKLELSGDRLRELAGEIGSDCAFFVAGGTAFCTGRGESVQQLCDIPTQNLVLLYPNEVTSTPRVYHELGWNGNETIERCEFLQTPDARVWEHTHNRLEQSALRVSPKMQEVWKQTEHLTKFVSGSGSTIVYPVADEQESKKRASQLRDLGQVFEVHTLSSGSIWRGTHGQHRSHGSTD